jgi:transcriptional regulator with XRE-family HTH domain
MASLGEVLRQARLDCEWTLREVEARSGIRNAHLSQIESGVIERPDVALLWTLAGLYNLDFGTLMRLSGRTSGAGEPGRRRSLAGAALRAMDDLTPEQQQEALAFMDQLRKAPGAGRSRRVADRGQPWHNQGRER